LSDDDINSIIGELKSVPFSRDTVAAAELLEHTPLSKIFDKFNYNDFPDFDVYWQALQLKEQFEKENLLDKSIFELSEKHGVSNYVRLFREKL